MHGATYPYAIKNQRKARKPLVGGFGCLELVLYGIRELAKHHYELLGNDLDIEWTTLDRIGQNTTLTRQQYYFVFIILSEVCMNFLKYDLTKQCPTRFCLHKYTAFPTQEN